MSQARAKVLVVAEAANPEWASVPLVGWSLANALRGIADVHLVTQVRNREAILRAGLREGVDFTAIDTEDVSRKIWQTGVWLKEKLKVGWTTSTALSALSYYVFEERLWKRFGDDLRSGRFDVVHRVTPLTPTTPSLIARRCKAIGVPFVWGPINGGVAWPKQFADVLHAEGEWLSYVRGAYRLMPAYASTRSAASAIIVGSEATWSELRPYWDRCVYVPENAIDPARFGNPSPPPAEGPLRAVFVGRLVPYKGADMLLKAAAPLIRAGKVRVDILGDGPQRAELEALIAAEGIAGGASLLGWVPHQNIHERLRACHLFAFPSVREFGGGVVLEAMALGLPPAVVNYAGPAELVTDTTGFRLPLGTREEVVASFRRLLERLADDRTSLSALGQRAHQRVLDWFTWEKKAAQVGDVYDWVLGRAAKPDFGMPFGDAPRSASSGASALVAS
jgi:glycosyltransferase involved in cell wall biosynthesis